jgi:hypothetical protein
VSHEGGETCETMESITVRHRTSAVAGELPDGTCEPGGRAARMQNFTNDLSRDTSEPGRRSDPRMTGSRSEAAQAWPEQFFARRMVPTGSSAVDEWSSTTESGSTRPCRSFCS